MKKLTSVLLILIIFPALMTGCNIIDLNNNSGNSKLTQLLAMAFSSGGGTTAKKIAGPSIVSATDGDYTDKVDVAWSSVQGAVSYNVYRSDNLLGTYDRIGTVDMPETNGAASIIIGSIMMATASTELIVSIPTPANGAADVEVDTAVTADFNKNVNCSTVTSSSFTLTQGSTSVTGTVSCSGPTATFTPSANLANNTTYTATITTAVLDLDGAPMAAPYIWSFTTEDTSPPVGTPPSVSIPTPPNGATNISIYTVVMADFNENVNCSTVTPSSFTLTRESVPVIGTVSCSGSTATFRPLADLAKDSTYTATITTAVQDLDGNAMTAPYTWSFKTAAPSAPPEMHSFSDDTITPGIHYYYAVEAVFDGGEVSTMSLADDGFARVSDYVPGKVEYCSATDGGYADRVNVSWTAAANATYYKVYRRNENTVFLIGDNVTATTLDDTTVPPGSFSYKIAPFNASGEGPHSDSETGFRSITNNEFFDEAYKHENAALRQLELLKKTGPDMMGTETVYDKDGDGTCLYIATLNTDNMTARAIINFSNYCDLYLLLNGTHVLEADMYMNGTIKGLLNVSGIYNGYIRYDIILYGGATSGGYYYISQDGGAETTLPFDYVQPF